MYLCGKAARKVVESRTPLIHQSCYFTILCAGPRDGSKQVGQSIFDYLGLIESRKNNEAAKKLANKIIHTISTMNYCVSSHKHSSTI